MKTHKIGKKVQMPAYLYADEYQRLKNLKTHIRTEYGQFIPITEMIRDSVKMFLGEIRKEIVPGYLREKAW